MHVLRNDLQAMTVAEATRTYQATLEAYRRLRTETEGSLSFCDEREAAENDLFDAEVALRQAWYQLKCAKYHAL